jgi:hypothetical protein
MLENMQLSNVAGAEPVAAPFASAGQALSPSSSAVSSAPAFTAAPAAAPAANPWANITPPSNTAVTPIPTAAAATNTTTTTVKGMSSTPLLDTFTKPLLSSDTKTVGLCTKKLVTDDASDQETLEQANQALSRSGSPWSDHLAEKTCNIILGCLVKNVASKLTFVLLLLRIVVLQSTSEPAISLVHCLEWLQKELTGTAASTVLTSPTARAMAWLTVSNACGCPSLLSVLSLESLVEAAVVDISLESQPRPEIRQAACAWLYNVALLSQPSSSSSAAEADGTELSDMLVSMLCACLEGVATEPDATARLRRLMVAGRILKGTNGCIRGAAKSLVTDLGFEELLTEIAASSDQTGDAYKCKTLARELVQVLNV